MLLCGVVGSRACERLRWCQMMNVSLIVQSRYFRGKVGLREGRRGREREEELLEKEWRGEREEGGEGNGKNEGRGEKKRGGGGGGRLGRKRGELMI